MYRNKHGSVNRWTAGRTNPHAGEPTYKTASGKRVTYKAIATALSEVYEGRKVTVLYPNRVLHYLMELRGSMPTVEWQQYEALQRKQHSANGSGYVLLRGQNPRAGHVKVMLTSDLLKALDVMQSIPHDTKQEMEVAA